MASCEAALRALHVQTDFEVIGAGGELAAAAVRRAQSERQALDAAARRAAVLGELRRLQAVGSINTAAVASLRTAYRGAVGHETTMRGERDRAVLAEDGLRDMLALLRHRAGGLERAADGEACAAASRRLAREAAQLDDWWLAATRRTPQ